MRHRLLLAVTTAALLGVTAPGAHAAAVHARCGYDSVSGIGPAADADTYSGVAYGVAAFDDQDIHTLRCYVTVDGAEQSATVSGSGSTLVIATGTVSFVAPVEARVALCTEIDGVTTSCEESTTTYVPPWEVLEIVYALIDDCPGGCGGPMPDPLLCPVLASLSPGIPGVVDITSAGDVTIVGAGPFWDCPPYGDLFPPA